MSTTHEQFLDAEKEVSDQISQKLLAMVGIPLGPQGILLLAATNGALRLRAEPEAESLVQERVQQIFDRYRQMQERVSSILEEKIRLVAGDPAAYIFACGFEFAGLLNSVGEKESLKMFQGMIQDLAGANARKEA